MALLDGDRAAAGARLAEAVPLAGDHRDVRRELERVRALLAGDAS